MNRLPHFLTPVGWPHFERQPPELWMMFGPGGSQWYFAEPGTTQHWRWPMQRAKLTSVGVAPTAAAYCRQMPSIIWS